MRAVFKDRQDAGRQLGQQLMKYANRPDVIVLGLPRGGVPVAVEVAELLNAPLDVFLVRKLGVPGHEELAMGAIASGGVRVLNEEIVDGLRIPKEAIEQVVRREQAEMERRERAYRNGRDGTHLAGKIVILVDDGLATGATMRSAVAGVKRHHPARVIVGVPTAAPDICREFRVLVDEILCVMTPEPFGGVGLWYQDFSQTSDDEVRDALEKAKTRRGAQTLGETQPAG